MQKYSNKSGDSGIKAFEIGKDFILVEFAGRKEPYRYTYDIPGNFHVEQMKKLALAGKGLASYISKHVRSNYDH